MATTDIQEFMEQNRAVADRVEAHRGLSETAKQWDARREFLLRNISDYEEARMDQLLAGSMVWANHVFMGCRYNDELLGKVTVMAEGIVVEDAPVFKTREEIMKKTQGR
ncbi:hypothetical protein NHX12_010485 [Muraenolepis orangiensis]|uniref:XRN2-binding (XTBD) domain-containing protein n=1 Tax=Muraenolepis orangiensis TaxID=630683 RepID=A0A9Q0DJV8_9TELE|nr:hypothetical protein NHX12_010485 [Muraenolepis orangiensis]